MSNYTIHFYAADQDGDGKSLRCSADVQAKDVSEAAKLALADMAARGIAVSGIRRIRVQDDASGNMIALNLNCFTLYAKYA